MNFNGPLLRPIRILLFPFSLIYALVVWVRNRMYDRNMLPSSSFNFPLICVGNLSVGGTGKSTMVEFLLWRLKQDYRIGILSRGYKRKTRGYALANEKSTALEIGDEPMQFHQKFPELPVAVGEERLVAIPQLLHDRPDTQVILLDDAFQHRAVKAGFNIILTEYSNLFTRDWFLPTGDLRDLPSSSKRCQVVIVTKCPPTITESEAREIKQELNLSAGQELYFSSIEYGQPYHILNKGIGNIHGAQEVLLISGIANPAPLKQYLHEHSRTYYEMLYGDHHIFTIDDWKEICKRFDGINAAEKIILTTEKDAVRLDKFASAIGDYPLYVLPIEMKILFNQEQELMQGIRTFINHFPVPDKTN
jgi:tetraacyldisaccharide 4'-kinase